jgi:hypothetical protein
MGVPEKDDKGELEGLVSEDNDTDADTLKTQEDVALKNEGEGDIEGLDEPLNAKDVESKGEADGIGVFVISEKDDRGELDGVTTEEPDTL